MAEIIIYGPAASSYLRTTRMACVEKGVEHELRAMELGGEEHRARHPYLKVPTIEHGDVRLYETNAILHYLDRAFDSGTRLIPEGAASAALAEQWVSVLNCYMYEHLVRQYSFAYIRPAEGGPDRARIDAAMKEVRYDLDLLEKQLERTPYLAGDALSHADLVLVTPVQTAAMFPEAEAALEERPKLSAWFAGIADRPSAEYLAPPPPPS